MTAVDRGGTLAPMQFSPERLRLFREEADLSRDALAERAGVSKSTVKRLEKSGPDVNMRMDTLQRLADALDRPLNQLMVNEADLR